MALHLFHYSIVKNIDKDVTYDVIVNNWVAIYGCTLATKALGSDKALRLLRPQARLQQVRVADLPDTPVEGHSSLLVLGHSN